MSSWVLDCDELCQDPGPGQAQALPGGLVRTSVAITHSSMARGGFKGHISQPAAFTSSQKDTKYVSPLALGHPALGDVSGKALGLPLALQSNTS